MLRSPLKSGNLSYSLLCMERVYCSSLLPLGQTREDDQIIVCIVLQFLSPLYSYSSCIMRNKTLYAECGMRASPGAAVKLCLGDLLVMGSNPETASLHMQG